MLTPRPVGILLLLFVVAAAPRAQAPGDTALHFEVASIKPNTSGSMRTNFTNEGDRFFGSNVTLGQMLRVSYDMPFQQISGGPDWLHRDHFDVVARASRVATVPEFMAMLRALLAERFALRVHVAPKDLPVYELTFARADGQLGPGLRRSTLTCADGVAPCMLSNLPGRIVGRGIPVDALSHLLSNWVDDHREVRDTTGITGTVDVDLEWTPNRAYIVPDGVTPPPIDPDGAPLFTALREQLGLRLVPAKDTVQVLVVDHAEHPTPD